MTLSTNENLTIQRYKKDWHAAGVTEERERCSGLLETVLHHQASADADTLHSAVLAVLTDIRDPSSNATEPFVSASGVTGGSETPEQRQRRMIADARGAKHRGQQPRSVGQILTDPNYDAEALDAELDRLSGRSPEADRVLNAAMDLAEGHVVTQEQLEGAL